MRKPLIAANWKLNGDLVLCRQFAEALTNVQTLFSDASKKLVPEVLVCPPAVYINSLSSLIGDAVETESQSRSILQVGAQNVAVEESGAFTGEISAQMLAEAGANYCIVGHSERRALFGETDADVLAKCQRLAAENITPIFCIGEPLDIREQGDAEGFVASQLRSVLSHWSGSDATKLVLAYEPLWAIGTGVSATPGQVQAMHQAIRHQAAEYLDSDQLRVLYGGSVKADVAAELLALDDVDGALVGGASLQVDEFRKIIAAA